MRPPPQSWAELSLLPSHLWGPYCTWSRLTWEEKKDFAESHYPPLLLLLTCVGGRKREDFSAATSVPVACKHACRTRAEGSVARSGAESKIIKKKSTRQCTYVLNKLKEPLSARRTNFPEILAGIWPKLGPKRPKFKSNLATLLHYLEQRRATTNWVQIQLFP